MTEHTTVLVSVSGGRTSAYMAWMMVDRKEDVAEYLSCDPEKLHYEFVFANTGMEHDDTLRFMADVDKVFGLDVVWVEGVVHEGERKSTTHRVVDYATAFRAHQFRDPEHPFHAHIRKYGIPNVKFLGCTREMKRNTIRSYMRSLGFDRMSEYYTAIGIRVDENRRVSKNADAENIIYPLVHLQPTDKDEVMEWWAECEYDLKIPEWQGNCVTCYKKSFKKLKQVYTETPEAYDFCLEMEKLYPRVGPEFVKHKNALPRTFFRQNIPTDRLLRIFESTDADPVKYIRDGGCSESCEIYETEETT